eukprot:CAMPEP_0185030876 /NCGR_PEP_ID=MMETSP1103-20130426/17995_1 /TAXON_ID=36769 /ORGANISM="Paraphysomonas bandaiensis, Strain Caron Lab Isolate" /LENGTH=324 /DNA_ID=CAMNT_0027566169 /DNA_START=212 /DNA_END=1186 /DNA_ORIENTATION=-
MTGNILTESERVLIPNSALREAIQFYLPQKSNIDVASICGDLTPGEVIDDSMLEQLFMRSRCGKLDAWEQLNQLCKDDNYVAKAYTCAVLMTTTTSLIPPDSQRAESLSRDVQRWVHEDPARSTNPHIQCFFGLCHIYGTGVNKDHSLAVSYFHDAASKGLAVAQCNLGVCFERAEGIHRDFDQAARCFLMAAQQGDPVAQCNMGVCYERGWGVSQDNEEAIRYYSMSAEQGHPSCLYYVGRFYETGRGVRVDYARAMTFYQLAIEQGHSGAAYNLARMYEMGCGVPVNVEKAIHFYHLSAATGNSEATQHIERLAVNSTGSIE